MKYQALLLEPDPYLAGIYASKFEREQIRVTVVETLAAARKRLAKGDIDAFLLDLSVDRDKALALISEVRTHKATKDLPILPMTELGDRETVNEAFAAGATDYFIKGHFVPIEAARKLKRIVEGVN